jgi:hypothetical protein
MSGILLYCSFELDDIDQPYSDKFYDVIGNDHKRCKEYSVRNEELCLLPKTLFAIFRESYHLISYLKPKD